MSLSACQERTTLDGSAAQEAQAAGEGARPWSDSEPVSVPDQGGNVSYDPQMQAAFKAVYGQAPPFTDATVEECSPGVREPALLVELEDQLVALIVTTRVEFIHACSGPVSIHYLRAVDGDLQLVRSWPDLLPGDDHGASAQVRARSDLFPNPALESTGGGSGQGYTCTRLSLVELTPSGPVRRFEFLNHWDDAGTDPPRKPDFDATVEAGGRHHGLVIKYVWEGGRTGEIPLRRRKGIFTPATGERLPDTC